MPQQKVLYFDIEGISCTGCTGLIEDKLKFDRRIKEIKVNVVTKRARVVVNDDVNAKEVMQAIKDIDDKFTAHWLLPKDVKRYYFSITGIGLHDRYHIQNALDANKEDIINSEVNYSTGVVTITSFYSQNPEKNKQHTEYLIKLIENSIKRKKGNKIQVKQFESPIKDEHVKTQPALLYYRKALINALVGIPLFLISGIIPLPLTAIGQTIGLFIGGLIAGVMWTTGKDFYVSAWKKLIKDHSSDMNTLIALGTGSAWVYSMIIALFPTLFPIAALQYHFLAINMILGIINFGKGMRANAEEKTKSKVQKLAQVYAKFQPQYATKLINIKFEKGLDPITFKDNIIEIPYLDIKEGDTIFVPAHKRIPCDGVIISGETMIDETFRTGENAPNNKKEGDIVLSGSLNKKHPIYMRATKNGPDGELAQTIRLMDKASESKPSISRKIDRLATVFVPTIILISFMSAMGWLLFGPAPVLPWLIKSVMSVYLCACPCALWLSYPIAVEIGMRKLYNQKILVKDASVFEIPFDTVVFDKTGVLTKPAVSMEDSVFSDGWDSIKVMQYAARLEAHYQHPIATAISSIEFVDEKLTCERWREGEQGGVSGLVNNCEVLIGNDAHLSANNIAIPKHFIDQESINALKGMSTVYIAINGECVAVIALTQEIRHDAQKVIKHLQERDIDVIMLTGDKKAAAKTVAEKIGITKYFAGCTSKEKEKVILRLKERKANVVMVGDEVNDLEAMKASDLPISFGSCTNAATKANVVISQLTNILHLRFISKETMNIIDQNLYWTGFYNLLSLMAATGLLYSVFGFVLNPIVASLSMTLSSIFVVLNSMRLNSRIDYVIGVYENKIMPPTTFVEWVGHIFAVNKLFQLLKDTVYGKPVTKSEPQSQSPRSPRKAAPVPTNYKEAPSVNIPSVNDVNANSIYRPIVLEDEKIPAAVQKKLIV